MDLSLAALFAQMASYPTLAVILVLVIGVTLIAGATDAPNAIATALLTPCSTWSTFRVTRTWPLWPLWRP